jgi:hypothetical protein
MDLETGKTDTRIGELEFEHGVPTVKTVTKLWTISARASSISGPCRLSAWSRPGRSGKHHRRSPW